MKQKISYSYYEFTNTVLKFPDHSPLVHKLFNPYYIALFLAVVSIVVLYWAKYDTFGIGFMTLFTLVVYVKQVAVQYLFTGHGVRIRKDPKKTIIFGLPIRNFIFLLIPVILSLVILALSIYSIINVEQGLYLFGSLAKTIAFPTLLVISCVLVLLTWKFHMYYETWYGSDYDARMEFKKRGYNDEEITYAIEQLYKIGILYKHEEPED